MKESCLKDGEIAQWVHWPSEMSTHPKWVHVRSCTFCAEAINQHRNGPVAHFEVDTYSTQGIAKTKEFLPPLSIPKTVEGYRLDRFLGLGSSGQVWLAEELGVGRQVAIKYLNQFGLMENRTRLLREARILSSVNHPSLLRIFGSGSDDSSAWLILEYCPGGSLGDLLRNRMKFSPGEAASLLVQIAEGLVLVHEKGIIHRDIKPDNILFSHDGKPRLADFGLAKLIDATSSLTTKGDVLGTPAYISPEQVRGGKIGPPADIHALGGVLYHLLTGSPPFKAASAFQAMALADSVRPISPLITDPTLPVDLVNVCLKCLQKNPRDRYHSVADFVTDLRKFLAGQKVIARPLGMVTEIIRWSAKNRLLSLSILATLVTMIAATFISMAFAVRAVAEKNIADISTTRAENQYYNSQMRSIQNAVDQGSITLARRKLVGLEPNETGRDYRGFEWYYWNRQLKKTPEEFSLNVKFVRRATISPKGSLLLLDSVNQLHSRDNLTGLTHRLSTPPDSKLGDLDPKGLFALITNAMGKGLLLDSRSNISQPVGPMSAQAISSFLLGPDGKEAVVFPMSRKDPIYLWDLSKNQRSREVGLVPPFIGTPLLDPAGKKVAFILKDNQLGILDLANGKMLVSPAMEVAILRKVRWNPEGTALAAIGVDGSGYGQLLRWIPGNEPILMPFPDGRQPIQLAVLDKEHLAVVDFHSTIHFFNPKLNRTDSKAGSGNVPTAIWHNETKVGVVDDFGNAQEFHSPSVANSMAPKNKEILSELAWFCPDKLLFTGIYNKAELRAFPFNRANPLTLENGTKPIHCAADRKGRVFVAMGDKIQRIDHDGNVLYSSKTPKPVRSLGAEGDRILVSQSDGTDILLDAESLALQLTLPGPSKAVALSPSDDKVVLITPTGTIKIIRTLDGSELEEFDPQGTQPTGVTISTNGIVYVSYMGGLIRAFEPGKRHIPKDFQGHSSPIATLDLSPDNKRLASGSIDGQIRIWDLSSGEDLLVLNSKQIKSVLRLRFSPDGQKLGCTTTSNQPDIFDARP